jgi:hypothetical protein
MPLRGGTSGPASNSPLQGADSSSVRERALIWTFYLRRQGAFDQSILKPPETILVEPRLGLRGHPRHRPRRCSRGAGSVWLGVLRENEFAVDLPYWPRTLASGAMSQLPFDLRRRPSVQTRRADRRHTLTMTAENPGVKKKSV